MTSHGCVPSPSQIPTKIPIYPAGRKTGLFFALCQRQKCIQGEVTSSVPFIHLEAAVQKVMDVTQSSVRLHVSPWKAVKQVLLLRNSGFPQLNPLCWV